MHSPERTSANKTKKIALSLKDIAKSARVSQSTVSRALRNSPLVSVETRARIRRIAAESNFRVSHVGRSLATGRTHSIGVVVSSISDPFIAEVVGGLEEVASEHGYPLILATSQGDTNREIKMVHTFEDRRVDGVVLTGGSRLGPIHVPMLAEMNIPVVVMNGQGTAHFAHSVVVDNVAAGKAVVRFLVHLGHRRIAYIGDRFGFESNAARQEGYRQGLAAHDLPFQPDLVRAGDAQPESGVLAMEQLLSLPEPPTAVFCYDDLTALGALRAISRRHLRVPEDISVVGFDDLLIAQYTQPPLTTIRQPKRIMGRVAAETLFNLLAGRRAPETRRLPTELIVRESTAPPPK
jgi:LacI family repressor for deo operon, udp, cdd, tsx, nupC, and nupG